MNLRIPAISSISVLFLMVFFSSLLLQFYLPWWIVVVIGFTAGLISVRPAWQNVLIVFAGIGLLWLSASLYIALAESTVLLPRMAGLLQLPYTWMVYAATVLTGALPASLAALAGSWLILREQRADDPA